MKKLVLKKSIFLLFISFFLSCQVGDNFNDEAGSENQSIKVVSFDVDSGGRSFTTSGTMLSFPTFQDYENTIEMLENQLEAHREAFYSQYENLTDDELSDVEDNSTFDPQQPLIDFENQYGITNSLRQYYNTLEEAWLNNQELDPATDPDNDILFDEIEQTLLNEHQEIMIEGKVYAFEKIQAMYEILGDFGTSLTKINNGEDVSNDPNIIETSKNSAACTTWKSRWDYDYYSSTRRIKRRLTIRSLPWFCKTLAQNKSYKKKNGRWKKRATRIGVSLQKYLKGSACYGANVRVGYKSKSIRRRRTRTVRMFDFGYSHALRARKGQSLFGTFYRGGSSSGKVLTW